MIYLCYVEFGCPPVEDVVREERQSGGMRLYVYKMFCFPVRYQIPVGYVASIPFSPDIPLGGQEKDEPLTAGHRMALQRIAGREKD